MTHCPELKEITLARSSSEKIILSPSLSFSHQKVFDLLNHISENDLLVFNNTKVLPCRLIGQRVRLEQETRKTKVSVTLNKVIDQNVWTTFCKPLKKLKEGDKIIFCKVKLQFTINSFHFF